jgi:large subunit ribosomal protein L4
MKADVTTLEAKKAGSIELADTVFGLEPRADILHRMVTYQLAKRREGNRRIKTRGEIQGTTRKFVNQKGSGGARHGNRKVAQFRGGAKAFGPVVRDHSIKLPKKVRALALRHALSSKQASGALTILDEAKMSAPKTKDLKASAEKLGWNSVLVIDGNDLDLNFCLAVRNLPMCDVLPSEGANVYDILRAEQLVLTKAAVEQLEARLA